MREILFRGKRLADGKWIYGYYFEQDMPDGLRSYIRTSQTDRFGSDFSVDPDTVGQYTGAIDKNGKKIFEGDILQVFSMKAYLVFWDGEDEKFTLKNSGGYCINLYRNIADEHSVVGNIYDKPELLKGGENG